MGQAYRILEAQSVWAGLERRLELGNSDAHRSWLGAGGGDDLVWVVNSPLFCLSLHLCRFPLPFSECLFLAFACPHLEFSLQKMPPCPWGSRRGQIHHSISLTPSGPRLCSSGHPSSTPIDCLSPQKGWGLGGEGRECSSHLNLPFSHPHLPCLGLPRNLDLGSSGFTSGKGGNPYHHPPPLHLSPKRN